jgi:hypothetical protein
MAGGGCSSNDFERCCAIEVTSQREAPVRYGSCTKEVAAFHNDRVLGTIRSEASLGRWV